MMYTELHFSKRFAAAANDGLSGGEYIFPYAWSGFEIREWKEEAGVTQALFNAPPGNWEQNERGLAALPGREAEFQDGIGKALEYAKVLKCPRIHVMGGISPVNINNLILSSFIILLNE